MATTAKKKAPYVERKLTPRESLLTEAIRITTGDRNSSYGNPEDNFRNIADYWSSYVKQSAKVAIHFTPQDVAQMMILMKMARLATNPGHVDSLLDIAGYAACAHDCQVSAPNTEDFQ